MWEKYELGLGKETMSMVAKIIVWCMFFSWIQLLYMFGTGAPQDATIAYLINIILMLGVLVIAAKTTNHHIPIEAWVYIKNLFLNRPQELHYWVAEIEKEDSDKLKRIYKY